MAFFFAWSTTPGRSAQATEALDPTVLAGALTSSFRDEALQGSLATIRDLEGRYGAAQGQLESASEAVSGLEQRVMDLQMEVASHKTLNPRPSDGGGVQQGHG